MTSSTNSPATTTCFRRGCRPAARSTAGWGARVPSTPSPARLLLLRIRRHRWCASPAAFCVRRRPADKPRTRKQNRPGPFHKFWGGSVSWAGWSVEAPQCVMRWRRRRDSNPRPAQADYALARRCIRRSATSPDRLHRDTTGSGGHRVRARDRRSVPATSRRSGPRTRRCSCPRRCSRRKRPQF